MFEWKNKNKDGNNLLKHNFIMYLLILLITVYLAPWAQIYIYLPQKSATHPSLTSLNPTNSTPYLPYHSFHKPANLSSIYCITNLIIILKMPLKPKKKQNNQSRSKSKVWRRNWIKYKKSIVVRKWSMNI